MNNTSPGSRSSLVPLLLTPSLLAMGFGGGYYLGSSRQASPQSVLQIVSDTVTVRDTVRINPVSSSSRHLPGRAVTLPVANPAGSVQGDSVSCTVARLTPDGDSVRLIPTVRVYADSNYRAVVSGINPSLDSLVIYPPFRSVTTTRTLTSVDPHAIAFGSGKKLPGDTRGSRWGLGIAAGLTATSRGLAPGITLGLTYRLF